MRKLISIVLSLMFLLQSTSCISFATEKTNNEKNYSVTETNSFIKDAFKEIQPFFERSYYYGDETIIGNKLAQLETEKKHLLNLLNESNNTNEDIKYRLQAIEYMENCLTPIYEQLKESRKTHDRWLFGSVLVIFILGAAASLAKSN